MQSFLGVKETIATQGPVSVSIKRCLSISSVILEPKIYWEKESFRKQQVGERQNRIRSMIMSSFKMAWLIPLALGIFVLLNRRISLFLSRTGNWSNQSNIAEVKGNSLDYCRLSLNIIGMWHLQIGRISGLLYLLHPLIWSPAILFTLPNLQDVLPQLPYALLNFSSKQESSCCTLKFLPMLHLKLSTLILGET